MDDLDDCMRRAHEDWEDEAGEQAEPDLRGLPTRKDVAEVVYMLALVRGSLHSIRRWLIAGVLLVATLALLYLLMHL